MSQYCDNPFRYQRRKTRVVEFAGVKIGGGNPILPQSMLTSDTMDTAACVQQTLDLVKAGCQMVRITAPTKKDAANLENIKKELIAAECHVPLVADIHFKPEAAMIAAEHVDKIRINPGNFVDKKKFKEKEYSDDEYAEEVARIDEAFTPLVQLCKERKIAMRIGTNHGSLSDRIMNFYGDTPMGMVESALEFARVARQNDFHNFVFSMKASNPKVMINAYRLLISKLEEEGPDWNYPLHLGVTEAGEGVDGRIKSAIGIGSLLMDGLGDTIRVSLTEDSIHEIPVCRALIHYVETVRNGEQLEQDMALSFDPFNYEKRNADRLVVQDFGVGREEPCRVFTSQETYDALKPRFEQLGDTAPEIVYETSNVVEIDLEDEELIKTVNNAEAPMLVTVKDGCKLNPVVAFRVLASKVHPRHPVLLKDHLLLNQEQENIVTMLGSAVHIGSLLCDGIGDAILIRGEQAPGASVRLGFNILQAAGTRIFKTDYVACPSCGRTLFDLQSTTARIKAGTEHLKGVKIAVMGCIVNGPGEMADADFGYVGGAPGKINLYVGKTPVKFNIPEAEAVARLQDLIREHGKWVDPPKDKPASDADQSADEPAFA